MQFTRPPGIKRTLFFLVSMLRHMNTIWEGERLVKDSSGKTIAFLHAASRGLVGGRAHLH
jgi:hypothetical protein